MLPPLVSIFTKAKDCHSNDMEGRDGEKEGEQGVASSNLLAVSVVCTKKYEETESCGSSADFLSGAAINDGKDDIGSTELVMKEEGVGVDLFERMVDNDNTIGQSSSINVQQSTDDALPDVPHKRKMPKKKKKFGKGARRGGDRKSGRSDTADQHVEPAVPGDAVAACVVVKRLNKKQLQQRLDCNTKKLQFAEKKVTATQKKLLTTKEHCKQLASLALERQKEGRHAQKELGHAHRRINDITADACDRIIEERASNTAQAKSKAASALKRHQKELNRLAASAQKRHQKELNQQKMACDDAIDQMQLTMKDNEKKALSVRKRQAAKSIAANKRHKKESNKSKRLIQRNLHDLSVTAAKNNDLEMKVASHLKTQASHDNAMAELMLSHRSKVDELASTHAFNLDVEKNNLRQRISSERKLQNALYNEILDSRQIKRDACKSLLSMKMLAAQRLHRMKEWRSRVSCDVELHK